MLQSYSAVFATSPDDAIDNYIHEQIIQAKVNKSGWGVGGDKQRIVELGTALIQGLVNGNINQGVANASAPFIASEIAKNLDKENKAGRIAAHGIANVALALAKGENAAAQSLGAMTGEAMGMLSVELYHKEVHQLTEDEKATISAFASLAAGIAGGLVGGDIGSTANEGQAGKTTVENKALAVPAPVPVPGVPVGPGDKVKQDADKNIASGLDGAIKDLGEALDKSTQCSFGRAGSSDDGEKQDQPNVAGNMTDDEKTELGGAGSGTPGGWEPQDEENARNSEAIKQQQQNKFDELGKLYDKGNPSQIFESQNLTDHQIQKYAQQLADETPLKEVRPGIFTAKLENGTSITLRNISTLQGQTGARWTIDIKGNQQLSDIAYKFKDVEIKFK